MIIFMMGKFSTFAVFILRNSTITEIHFSHKALVFKGVSEQFLERKKC